MSFLLQPLTLQSLFGKKRTIGPINVQVPINDSTNDTLTITKQPVQQGASITDHSFKEPTVYTMTAYFKDNPSSVSDFLAAANPFGGGAANGLAKVYQELLDLQNTRQPFDVVTPKRIYRDVLLAVLSQTTDKATENCLAITMGFQEILLVSVTTTTVPRLRQKFPKVTSATQKAGKKSAARTIADGVRGQ